MLFFRIKTYLHFLWKSTNQHGIHSPFVYKLVTQCFYKKKYDKQIQKVHCKFIAKLYHYFQPKNTSDKIDILVSNNLNDYEIYVSQIHNDTIFVFKNIYRNKLTAQAWKKLTKEEKITVTIDTYRYGLVFFRKEQQKQNFVVRR